MLDRSNEQRATAGLALAQAEFVHATAIANADSVYNAKAAPLEELRQEIATLPKDETPDKADLLREIDAKIQVLVTQHDVDIAAADQALATAKATNAETLDDIQKSFDASVCGSDQ